MTLVHSYDGADVTGAIAITSDRDYAESAVLGQPETITVMVDDATSARDFLAYKTWRIRETAAPSGNQTVWAGVVGDVSQSWGGAGIVYPNEPGVVWELQLHEANHWLSRRLLRTFDRTATETVSARLTALLALPELSGIIVDHGLVAASSVEMDPHNYGQQTALAVLQDCANQAGFGFFLRYRDASSDFELAFFDWMTSTLDDSAQVISTDEADGGYAPGVGYKRRFGASRLASGILTPYPGGVYYEEDTATGDAYGYVDQVAPASYVKTKAKAVALTQRLLVQHAEQDVKITDLVLHAVSAANVNDIRKGQLTSARFPRFKAQGGDDSWEELRAARVLTRRVSRSTGDPQDLYDLVLELVPVATLTPTATHARLEQPNDNYADPNPGFVGWDSDGDNPGAGQTYDPKYGSVDYYPIGSEPPGGWTGFQVSGTGTLDVDVKWTATGVISGILEIYSQIQVNGGTVHTHTWTDAPASGLRFYSAIIEYSTSISVADADVVQIRTSDINGGGGGVIPSGAGQPSNRFVIDGTLYS